MERRAGPGNEAKGCVHYAGITDQLRVRTKVCNNCDDTSGVQSQRHFVALKYRHIRDFPVSLIASNFRLLLCNSSLRIP